MIKYVWIALLALTTWVITSCKKEESTIIPPVEVDNHINFKANDTLVTANYKVLLQDPIFNAYYKQGQALELQRLVENGNPQRIMFRVDRIDLENIDFPITINYSIDHNHPTLSTTYVNTLDIPFGTNINNAQEFSFTINSYTDRVLNGHFEGTLYSGNPADPKVTISEGVLNLQLNEY